MIHHRRIVNPAANRGGGERPIPAIEAFTVDEPASGVDPVARRAFWYTIDRLAQAGTTASVSTHYRDEAEYGGRLGIMSAVSAHGEGTFQEAGASWKVPPPAKT